MLNAFLDFLMAYPKQCNPNLTLTPELPQASRDQIIIMLTAATKAAVYDIIIYMKMIHCCIYFKPNLNDLIPSGQSACLKSGSQKCKLCTK